MVKREATLPSHLTLLFFFFFYIPFCLKKSPVDSVLLQILNTLHLVIIYICMPDVCLSNQIKFK